MEGKGVSLEERGVSGLGRGIGRWDGVGRSTKSTLVELSPPKKNEGFLCFFIYGASAAESVARAFLFFHAAASLRDALVLRGL
jgi:hypothetical protein